jgi:hypothetical protein
MGQPSEILSGGSGQGITSSPRPARALVPTGAERDPGGRESDCCEPRDGEPEDGEPEDREPEDRAPGERDPGEREPDDRVPGGCESVKEAGEASGGAS